jgi:hypothetical protein
LRLLLLSFSKLNREERKGLTQWAQKRFFKNLNAELCKILKTQFLSVFCEKHFFEF